MRQRTSVLAAFSFLSGLAAVTLVTVAWFLTYLTGILDMRQEFRTDELRGLMLAARILAGVTVLPAVVSLAFWLAARGAVRESQGALMGVGLYRSGIILSVLSVMFALAGRMSVTSRIDSALAESRQTPVQIMRSTPPPAAVSAWLGVQLAPVDEDAARALKIVGGARITKIVPESPASKVGLKEGMIIVEIDRIAVESDAALIEEIRHRAPGTRIALLTLRDIDGERKLETVEAELGVMPQSAAGQTMPVPPKHR